MKITPESIKEYLEAREEFPELLKKGISRLRYPALLLQSIEIKGAVQNIYKCSNCGRQFEIETVLYHTKSFCCPYCKTNFEAACHESEDNVYYSNYLYLFFAVKDGENYYEGKMHLQKKKTEDEETIETCWCSLGAMVDGTKKRFQLINDNEYTSTTQRFINLFGCFYYNTNTEVLVIGLHKTASELELLHSFNREIDMATKKVAEGTYKEIDPSLFGDFPTLPEATLLGVKREECERDLLNNKTTYKCECLNCGKIWFHIQDSYSRQPVVCEDCGTISSDPQGKTYAFVYDYSDKAVIKVIKLSRSWDGLYTIFQNPYAYIEWTPKKVTGYKKTDSTSWSEFNPENLSTTSLDEVYFMTPLTSLKYTGITEFCEALKGEYDFRLGYIFKYLKDVKKHPILESLIKIGLTREYVSTLQNSKHTKEVFLNKKSNNIYEAVALSKPLLKAYIAAKEDVLYTGFANMLSTFQEFYKFDPEVSGEDIKYCIDECITINSLQEINNAVEMKVHPMVKYLERVRLSQCLEPSTTVREWRDYLNAAKKIGVDLKDNHALYPSSLRKEHDIVVKKSSLIANVTTSKEFTEAVEKYRELAYHRDAYFVRCPENMQEMFEEGRKLRHCCGQYVDYVAKKKSFIFFLRHKETPDEPFLTVEITPDMTIRQLRGYNDSYVHGTPEALPVLDFVKHWAKMKHLEIDMY